MIELDESLWANTYIRNLTPYQPGKPIEEVERELGIKEAIKLASNENPLGPSPLALAAAHEITSKMHFYPDGSCYHLRQALAKKLALSPKQLTIGNGSENILEMIVKAYLAEGKSAVISQYCFLTIPLLIKSYGATIIETPAIHFGHDIQKMVTGVNESTRIIFIVNPNNPTGTFTTAQELVFLLDNISPSILVVVDEAYHEYIHHKDYPATLALLDRYSNLIITRTFSKAYGLAGLRIGYAISSPTIADMLNRARLPFNVNTLAAHAAEAALSDEAHLNKSIELNNIGMEQLRAGLHQLNIDYIPSLGNFITMHVNDASTIYQQLLQQGVIVRPLNAYGMPNHIRVTIGTSEQISRFLQTLTTLMT